MRRQGNQTFWLKEKSGGVDQGIDLTTCLMLARPDHEEAKSRLVDQSHVRIK